MNEIIDALVTLMQTAFTTTFTTYFKGQLKAPAQDNMPILTIYPKKTEQKHSGTVRDDVTYTIAVEIYVSIKQYFDNTAGQGTQLDTLDALVDLVEERESDGDLKVDTVMGIINANLSVSDRTLYTDNMQVEYDQYFTAENYPVAKVTVTFEAHDRPNRT